MTYLYDPCKPCCDQGSSSPSGSPSSSPSGSPSPDDEYPDQGWGVTCGNVTAAYLPLIWGMSPSSSLNGASCGPPTGADLMFTYDGVWSRPFPPATFNVNADANVIWGEALSRHPQIGAWRTTPRELCPDGTPGSPFGGTVFGTGQTHNPCTGICDASYTQMAIGAAIAMTCSWDDPEGDGIGDWTVAIRLNVTLDRFCRGPSPFGVFAPLQWSASYSGVNGTLDDMLCAINQAHPLINTFSDSGEDISLATNLSCSGQMEPDYPATIEIPGTVIVSPYGGGVPGVCENPSTTEF